MKKISQRDFANLLTEIGILKRIQRTGWVIKGVEDVESVAEHIWRVAIMALLLAEELKLDQLKLVKMALIHDLGEAIIGDIKWEEGQKVIGSPLEKHRDEKRAIERMFADNPSFSEYIKLWQEFNERKTKEAKAIKQLDKLEMVIQAYEYQKQGYQKEKFDEFWTNAQKYIQDPKLKKYFSYLKKIRKKI